MSRNLFVELAGGIPFGGASFLRGKQIFHPRGVAFGGEIELEDEVRALSPKANRHVTVRVSNGAGLPDPFPDVRGLGLRIHDAHGRGRHQDLALATGARPIGLRNMLLPAAGVSGAFFSSILPYRLDGRLVLFGASPDGPGDARSPDDLGRLVASSEVVVDLYVATLAGPWKGVGRIRLHRRLSTRESSRLALNPWNTGEAVRPAGLLNALRDPAYRWSQLARKLRGDARGPEMGAVESPSAIERVPISR